MDDDKGGMDIKRKYINTIPTFFIQSDWEYRLSQLSGSAWIACKVRDGVLNFGKILRGSKAENASVLDLTTTGNFTLDLWTSTALRVTYNTLYPCIFIAAVNVYSDIHGKSVTSLSANETTMCVSTSAINEELVVWSKEHKRPMLYLKGHVGDIYKCRWFPSGRVILTAGADTRLKIWCGETGRCPVTLTGHKRAVTDVAVVDRGRNIISVSKDGVCKLWDCGQSACIADLINVSSEITCCAISVAPASVNLSEYVDLYDREIGTENKILLIGCDDGRIICIAVRSRRELFTLDLDSAVTCCCTIKEESGLFAVGCNSGKIVIINTENESQYIQMSWFETNSPVLCLISYKQVGIFSGHMDGTCVFHSITTNDNLSRLYLTGSQDDPIYDISYDNKFIYTACRDSNIRRYFPQPYIKKYFKT